MRPGYATGRYEGGDGRGHLGARRVLGPGTSSGEIGPCRRHPLRSSHVRSRATGNNHVLNTLYLWALGPKLVSDYPYRLLSVACRIVTLAVLAWIPSRRAAIDGLFALVLAGSSYPLVLYWSEARGYAPAMLCAVLAFAILRSTWTRLGPGRVLAFWITLALGVLAHVTFVIPTFALMVAALVYEIRSGTAWWRRVGRLVVLFAVPLGFFVRARARRPARRAAPG